MIDSLTLAAFSDELHKLANASAAASRLGPLTKTKALGLLGLGAGAGIVGEQAKDDLLSGRRARQQQARAMNVSEYSL